MILDDSFCSYEHVLTWLKGNIINQVKERKSVKNRAFKEITASPLRSPMASPLASPMASPLAWSMASPLATPLDTPRLSPPPHSQLHRKDSVLLRLRPKRRRLKRSKKTLICQFTIQVHSICHWIDMKMHMTRVDLVWRARANLL